VATKVRLKCSQCSSREGWNGDTRKGQPCSILGCDGTLRVIPARVRKQPIAERIEASESPVPGVVIQMSLPADTAARKNIPLARGLLDYFPAALAAVAELSKKGNDKHNPGEDLHWARGKSMDHADCIMRHLVDRGTVDPEDGILHDAKVAWRALALLQETLEAAGAPLPRGCR
jgi:hypothetical protein